mgnify:CR=1 FL=1
MIYTESVYSRIVKFFKQAGNSLHFLFVCFLSHSRVFHSYGEVLRILTCALHSWPLSSDGSLISVPHLLWHWSSVCNGYLRGPVTLTPIAERLAVELSLPVFKTLLSVEARDSNTQPSASRDWIYVYVFFKRFFLWVNQSLRKTTSQSREQNCATE